MIKQMNISSSGRFWRGTGLTGRTDFRRNIFHRRLFFAFFDQKTYNNVYKKISGANICFIIRNGANFPSNSNISSELYLQSYCN